jgi:hypothetical protein
VSSNFRETEADHPRLEIANVVLQGSFTFYSPTIVTGLGYKVSGNLHGRVPTNR